MKKLLILFGFITLPIVAFVAGDSKKILEAYEYGFIVNNNKEFVEKSLWLLQNPIPKVVRLKNAQKHFIQRHIGPSVQEQNIMLNELGYKNLDELIKDTVPEKILLKDDLEIGDPNSEYKALRKLKNISKNECASCCLCFSLNDPIKYCY